MTSRLRFRNVDADPADPVETWPTEAVQAALERGGLSDYRRLAAAIRREPWGDAARRIEHVLTYSQPYGAATLVRRALERHRAAAIHAEKAEVARQLADALAASGLTQAEFAARLRTSPSRLSTYLKGSVTPSAAILVRAQQLARMLGRPAGARRAAQRGK